MSTKYFGGMDLAQIGTLTASAIVSIGLLTAGSLLVQGDAHIQGSVVIDGGLSVKTDAFYVNSSTGDVGVHTTSTVQPFTVQGNSYFRQGALYVNGTPVGSPPSYGLANPDHSNGPSLGPVSFGSGTPNEGWLFTTSTVVGMGGCINQSSTLSVCGNVSSTSLTTGNVTSTGTLAFNSASGTNLTVGSINLNGMAITGAQSAIYQNTPSSSIAVIGQVTGQNAERSMKVNNFVWTTHYTSSTSNLKLIDVSVPSAPVLAYTTTTPSGGPNPWVMANDGVYAFIADLYTNNISVYSANFVTSSQPQLLVNGPFGATGTASLVADGRFLYKLGNDGILYTLNYQSFSSSQITGGTPLNLGSSSNGVGQMVKYGNFLYSIDYGGGNNFNIIDVTDPLNPKLAYQTSIPGGFGLAVTNNKVYVDDWLNNILYVYDVSQPYIPVLSRTITNASVFPSFMTVAGPYLYIENYNTQAGIDVWDIFSSATPTKIATVAFGNYAFSDVIVDGLYLYLNNHYLGINTFDIYQVAGIRTQGIWAGTAKAGQMSVQNDLTVNGNSTMLGKLAVGEGISSQGYSYLRTVGVEKDIASTGSTGSRTVNAQSGCVQFASGATSLTVTNQYATTTSVIIPSINTNVSTTNRIIAVPAAGSFDLKLDAGPSAEMKACFFLIP